MTSFVDVPYLTNRVILNKVIAHWFYEHFCCFDTLHFGLERIRYKKYINSHTQKRLLHDVGFRSSCKDGIVCVPLLLLLGGLGLE